MVSDASDKERASRKPLLRKKKPRRPPSSSGRRDDDDGGGGTIITVAKYILAFFVLYLILSYLGGSGSGGSYADDAKAKAMELEQKAAAAFMGQGGGGGQYVASVSRTTAMLGYGPERPRVAVIVVGKDINSVYRSVESVFRSTELNRIFSVVAVLDGVSPNNEITKRFQSIDGGNIKPERPHTTSLRGHGSSSAILMEEETAAAAAAEEKAYANMDENTSKGQRIKLLYNTEVKGVGACRQYASEFLQLLQHRHELSGLKSPHEKLILLLLRHDATLESYGWIDPVTDALVPPPPQVVTTEGGGIGGESSSSGMLLNLTTSTVVANAVSLAVDYIDNADGTVAGGLVKPRQVVPSPKGSMVTFDLSLRPHWKRSITEAAGEVLSDLLGKDERPYWTPAVLGAATALRFDVYTNLPSRDTRLETQFASDLELSLNMWLCGDGIDVVPQARVAVDPLVLPLDAQITNENAARIAAAWMGKTHRDAVFNERREALGSSKDEMAKFAKEAMWAKTLPAKLKKKCRPFTWYASEINREVYVKGAVLDVEEERDVDPLARHKDNEAEGREGLVAVGGGDGGQHQYVSDINLDIISKAKPQDIKYVDFTLGGKEHPHMGAKDENDNLGYVHDAKALRRNPPAFHVDDLNAACKDDGNYQMLTKKVKVDLEAVNAAERSPRARAKIFCVIYTIEKAHHKIPAIRETWGQKCDGFMVASTKTDPSLDSVNLVHEGPEEYNNIWQKVRSLWSYVYDHYYDDYDWFHIGGDDLYVLVENLRLYVESDEIRSAENGGKAPWEGSEKVQTPLFLGRRFAEQGNVDRIFISGGSGYTINKAALKALVRSFVTCFPHMHTFSEDVMVATCFRKQGIFPYDTRDMNGGERYMPFRPGHHYNFKPPPGDIPGDKSAKDWYVRYTMGDLKLGLDHCAADSVAFHYVDSTLMRRMHAILYGHCKK